MRRHIRWDTALENIMRSNADITWKREALVRVHAFIKSQKPEYVPKLDFIRQGGEWVKSKNDIRRHSEYHEKERSFREHIVENYKRLVMMSLCNIEGQEFPLGPTLFQDAIVFLLDIDKQHEPILHRWLLDKAYNQLSSKSVRHAFARRMFFGGERTDPDDYSEDKDWGIHYIESNVHAAFARAVLADFPDDPDFAYLKEKLSLWEESKDSKAEDRQRGEKNSQIILERMRKPKA
jgi:hypothetical protein